MNLTKIKKKLNPDPDGQPAIKLQTATVTVIAADGTVDISLNGSTVADVPVLGSARFVVGSVVQVLTYRGSLLVLGGSKAATGQPVALASADATDSSLTTANNNFTNSLTTSGTALHGIAFIAPSSGRVQVLGRAVGRNGTANGSVKLDFEIRAGSTVGSGTVFRAASDITAGSFQSTTAGQFATLVTGDQVTGLTPGTVYNAVLAYAAAGNPQTITYNRRHITVLPQ